MKVFVSYRRQDTQDLAGRIADRLNATDGIDKVFIDVDGIEPGADFKTKIQTALAESDACLILIGEAWRGAHTHDAPPRLFDEADFVRLEAATALASGRRVIPLLANGAKMPVEKELPADLHRLPALSAMWIRHESFQHDIEYLTDILFGRKASRRSGTWTARHPLLASSLRICAGALAALIVLAIGAAVHKQMLNRSLDETLGGPGEVWLLIMATLICGAAIAWFTRPSRGPH